MIAACSLLIIVGLSDVLHSRDLSVPSPETTNNSPLPLGNLRRAALLCVTAVLLVMVAVSSPWWSAIGVVAGAALWLLTYRAGTQALGMVTTAIVTVALAFPALISRFSVTIFVPASDVSSHFWLIYQWVLVACAVIMINLTTANRVVRFVLRLAGTGTRAPTADAAPPRAGRIIGVLERYLLVTLILAGQGLSIAGMAAAKSIIRYPEISKSARKGGGLSAEEFFIGTVASWLLALASAGVVILGFS